MATPCSMLMVSRDYASSVGGCMRAREGEIYVALVAVSHFTQPSDWLQCGR